MVHDTKKGNKNKPLRRKLTLHPLSLEEALQAAMETGPPPESPRKGRAKMRRRQRKVDADKAD